MSDKPDAAKTENPATGEPLSATGEDASSAAKSARGGKARASVAIDLPPSAVSEVATEAPASADPAPQSPEPLPAPSPVPAKSPKFVPGLIGLVAGAIGGFGAYQGGDLVMPRASSPDPAVMARIVTLEQGIKAAAAAPAGTPGADVADRLAKAEAMMTEAAKREAMLRDEIARLGSALASESAERGKALAGFTEKLGALAEKSGAMSLLTPPAPTSAESAAEFEKLRARLALLETSAKALPEAIGALNARGDAAVGRVETLSPRLDDVAVKVETLAPKLGAANEQIAALAKTVAGVAGRDALAQASAIVASSGVLADAFARGEALAMPVSILRNLGIAADRLAPFAPFADKGAPSAAVLLAELRAIRPPSADGKPASEAKSADILDRIKAGALSLVEIRRTGDVTGTDDAAHIARAEQALQRGDIPGALALVGRLSARVGEAYAGWRVRAEGRIRAAAAADALRNESLAVLAKASLGPAKQ